MIEPKKLTGYQRNLNRFTRGSLFSSPPKKFRPLPPTGDFFVVTETLGPVDQVVTNSGGGLDRVFTRG